MAKIQNLFKNIIRGVLDTTGKDLLSLPEKIRNDLSLSLKENEEIVVTIKTNRAIYRAGTSKDSNTFYNTLVIVTSSRIILVKDSSGLNIFREFQLNQVNSLLYEDVTKKPTIHIDTVDSKYVLSMPPGSITEAKIFFEKFNAILKTRKLEDNYCRHCGNKIHTDSVYCSHCGKNIKDI